MMSPTSAISTAAAPPLSFPVTMALLTSAIHPTHPQPHPRFNPSPSLTHRPTPHPLFRRLTPASSAIYATVHPPRRRTLSRSPRLCSQRLSVHPTPNPTLIRPLAITYSLPAPQPPSSGPREHHWQSPQRPPCFAAAPLPGHHCSAYRGDPASSRRRSPCIRPE